MKKYLILLIVLLPVSIWAQVPGQVLVSSYSDTVDIVRFCHGVRQNSIIVGFVAGNLLYKSDPSLTIDSLRYIFSGGAFDTSGISAGPSFQLSEVFFGSGPSYSPQKPGDDTMIVRLYYGPYHSDGRLIYHSTDSPLLGLLGVEATNINLGGGIEIGNGQEELVTDTIHDKMNYGLWYRVSSTPQPAGDNLVVKLKSCGDVVVDSINQLGDFSEFNFYKLPTLPLQMHEGDSLVIPYIFIPHVVGMNKHYLVFHATNGAYLTWSFEYKVIDTTSGVSESEPPTSAQLVEYPNPTRSNVASFLIRGILRSNSILKVFNDLGQEMTQLKLRGAMESNESTVRISTANYPAGTYFATLYSGSHSSTIRFAVIH